MKSNVAVSTSRRRHNPMLNMTTRRATQGNRASTNTRKMMVIMHTRAAIRAAMCRCKIACSHTCVRTHHHHHDIGMMSLVDRNLCTSMSTATPYMSMKSSVCGAIPGTAARTCPNLTASNQSLMGGTCQLNTRGRLHRDLSLIHI